MKQFNKPGDNMGGAIKIWLVPPASVGSVSEGVLTLTDTTNVYELYCSPDSIAFEENDDRDRGGLIYTAKLSGFLPKDTIESLAAIEVISRQRYLAVYMDGNEQYKLVGTIEIPLRVTFDLATGKNTSDRNGHQVTITGKQKSKAQFIETPFG